MGKIVFLVYFLSLNFIRRVFRVLKTLFEYSFFRYRDEIFFIIFKGSFFFVLVFSLIVENKDLSI